MIGSPRTAPRHTAARISFPAISLGGLVVSIAASSVACNGLRMPSWVHNGFADPTQAGNYRSATRTEIRSAMSILEEPEGIEGAEEPRPDDLVPQFIEARIQAGDIIRVSIYELQAPGVATDQQIQVRPAGYETFPTIGQVKVAGLTPRELELELKRVLREEQILEDADVQVSVLRSQHLQYTVIGAVPNPGNFPLMQPDLRLLNALGAVGGVPTQVSRIYILRRPDSDDSDATNTTTAPVASGWPGQPAYTLSDFGGPARGGAPVRLARANMQNGELERLEKAPAAPRTAEPVFDPATGEWRIADPISGAQQPTTRPGSVPVTPNRPVNGDGAIPVEDGANDPFPSEWDMPEGTRILEIPTSALLAGDPQYNVVIRPRDVIRVPLPNAGEYYVGGNVQNPGTYQLTGRQVTVKQAIVSAGGFGPLAEPSRANLVRRLAGDEEQTIQIDLDAILSGETPDFYLRPNDTINVGSAPYSFFLAVFRNAFRLSYGFGFVYDRNFADSDSFQAREQVRLRELQEAQIRGLPL